ncbi:MAG: hypothetical protein WCL11_18155 [Verrucomicrobiota bacterium]
MLATAVVAPKALLELSGSRPALGIDLATFRHPDLSGADHQPAKQAQGEGILGITHAAVILAQGYVQSMMQSAFNHPAAPFEFEEVRCIKLDAVLTTQSPPRFSIELGRLLRKILTPQWTAPTRHAAPS